MGVLWTQWEAEEEQATSRLHLVSRRAFLSAAVMSGLLLVTALVAPRFLKPAAVAMLVWSLIVSLFCLVAFVRARGYHRRHMGELAMADVLTGLPNRKGLIAELEGCDVGPHELGKRVWLIDVDLVNLNRVNYEFGQIAGDAALQDIAGLLRRTVPPGNPVGRLGGDEFLVIMSRADAEEANELATAIEQAVADYRLNLGERGEIHSLKARVSTAPYLPEQASLHEAVISAKEAGAHGAPPEEEAEGPAYYHVPRVTLGSFAACRWQGLSKAEQEEFKVWKRECPENVTERMADEIVAVLEEKAETHWVDFVTAVPVPGGVGGGRTYPTRELAERVAAKLNVPYRDVMRADTGGAEGRSIEPVVDAVIDKGDSVLLVSDVISSGIVERRCVKKLSAAGAHLQVVAWAAY